MNIRIISVTAEDGTNLDHDGSIYEGFTGLYSFIDNITVAIS